MFFFNLKNNKKWFTLVETILVCSIFAIMVVWIIAAINRSYIFMDNTRLQVRATNYAREWVEMMFNIRDTNRRRKAWDKDACRLVKNIDVDNPCDNFFSTWLFTLEKWVNGSWDMYFYASWINLGSLEIDEAYGDNFWAHLDDANWLKDSKITYTWTYSIMERGYNDDERKAEFKTGQNIENLLWDGVEFYRLLRVYWVYDKTDGATDAKLAQEMRFCVKVLYRSSGGDGHSVELCSLMTNFED